MSSYLINYKYLSRKHIDGFDRYKYNSIDTSPLSKYIMHPFWNQLVKLCPLWLSANLLTLTGWLLSFFMFLLVSYYDPNFISVSSIAEKVPRWVWLAGGICIFLSHQLDGIDGKQARRTKTSSPLGELFDHGLDSSIVSLMGIGIFSIFGIGEKTATVYELVFVEFIVLLGFYIAHWEKYTTSILYLPWAYDISQLWLSGCYFVTFIYGPGLWRSEWIYGYSVAEVFKFLVYYIVAPGIIPISLYNQYEARKANPKKCISVMEGFMPLFSFFAVTVIVISYGFVTNMIELQPRLFLCAYGILYSNLNCRLIIAQMTDTLCDRFNLLAWPLFAMIVVSKLQVVDDALLLICYVTFLSSAHLHYGVNVVRQICDHLNINCFSIAKRPPRKHMNNGHIHSNGVSNGTSSLSNGKSARD